jgi:hypothetical protein
MSCARVSAVVLVVCWALALEGCSSHPVPSGPQPLTGSSKAWDVRGEYSAVDMDAIEHIAADHGTLVLRGGNDVVTVKLPAGAGEPKSGAQWVLITESKQDRVRSLTFTNDESLDDFTIELPLSDADVHYGTLTGSAGDLLVFAWGRGGQSYWGYVTISRR